MPACSHNINIKDYSIKISTPIHRDKGISREEVETLFFKIFKKNSYSPNLIEIVIYSYSSGKEIFFYSGNKNSNINSDVQTGSMEALVKIKQQGKLINIYFIKAKGKSKIEIIENLAKEVEKLAALK